MTPHENRRVLLDAMAALAGFAADLATEGLPDGSRPDVLRLDLSGRRLFIGDAKDVETPGNVATRARLGRYVAWAVAAASHGLEVVVAVCHGRPAESWRWVGSLVAALKAAGGHLGTCDVATLDPSLGVACLTLPAAGSWSATEACCHGAADASITVGASDSRSRMRSAMTRRSPT